MGLRVPQQGRLIIEQVYWRIRVRPHRYKEVHPWHVSLRVKRRPHPLSSLHLCHQRQKSTLSYSLSLSLSLSLLKEHVLNLLRHSLLGYNLSKSRILLKGPRQVLNSRSLQRISRGITGSPRRTNCSRNNYWLKHQPPSPRPHCSSLEPLPLQPSPSPDPS